MYIFEFQSCSLEKAGEEIRRASAYLGHTYLSFKIINSVKLYPSTV